MKSKPGLLVILFIAFLAVNGAIGATWYVDDAGSGDGSSWSIASATIQNAIESASAGDDIWVKQGSYSSCSINKALSIYGGFPDGISTPVLGDRNPLSYTTTVDGLNSATCFTVTASAIIDGFNIVNGSALNGAGIFNSGTATNVTIANCVFSANDATKYGGAICNNNIPSCTITDCTFSANNADWYGGGICNLSQTSATVTNSIFSANTAGYGGAIYNNLLSASLQTNITNCMFIGNSVARDGGAIYSKSTSPSVKITNCTLTENDAAGNGGGIYNSSYQSPTITNCILWANTALAGAEIHNVGNSPAITYSDIQGGFTGAGNINLDPQFVATDDCHLQPGSPCIDAGSNTAPNIASTDYEGDARIIDGDYNGTATADIGADEAPSMVIVPDVVDTTETNAEADLLLAGLTIGSVSYACNNTIASGNVILQSPAPGGYVSAESSVNLVVSTGPCTGDVTVPDVVDKIKLVAELYITSAGLSVGNITTEYHAAIAENRVISQNPASGNTVASGTSVDLVISDGPFPVTVPDVVDTTETNAEASILAGELTLGNITSQCDNIIAAGNVVSQSPSSGESVSPGTAVDLVISTGLCPVTMPNVINTLIADAQAAIISAGLTVGTITDTCSNAIAAGNVIVQAYAPGTSLPPETSIDLAVSTGPCTVITPNIVGMSLTDAEIDIAAAQLIKGVVTTAYSETVPADNVISQNPASESLVTIGTEVDMVISVGPLPTKSADLNLDRIVNVDDLLIIAEGWLENDPNVNIAGIDDFINLLDFTILCEQWLESNDECIDAIAVIAGQQYTGSSEWATGELISGCASNDPKDVWFSYTPLNDNQTTVISLCGSDFDTTLAVYEGCQGPEVACNDDYCGQQSQVTTQLDVGVTYFIRIAGQTPFIIPEPIGGNYILTIDSIAGVPENNECLGAIAVDIGQYTGSTNGASGSDISSCAYDDYIDVWYSYTPANSGHGTFSLIGSDFDTTLTVFDSCSGTELSCNDDYFGPGTASQISMELTAQQTYLIRIAGYDGSTGDYVLSVLTTNDDCQSALPISKNQEYAGSNIAATGSTQSGCAYNDIYDVWYSYTPTTSGYVEIALFDSDFDTTLAVYDSCGGTELACNDDTFDPTVSQVMVNMAAQTTYLIRVAGYDEQSGNFNIIVNGTDPLQGDDCSDAITTQIDHIYRGSTDGATGSETSTCSYDDTADVWYSITPQNSGEITISLCGSLFDTSLAVYDACGGTELACNDDYCGLQSEIDIDVTAGNTYLIRIAGYGGETGEYTLNIMGGP